MAFTDALREIYAFFGTEFDDSEIKKGDKTVNNTIKSVRELGTMLAGGFAVAGVTRFVADSVRMGSEIRNAAAQVGATTQEVSELSTMFRSVGLETDDVADAIAILQEKLVDAKDGSEDAADALKNIGIDFKSAQEEFPRGIDLFEQAANGLAGTETATERAGRALILFGDVGRKMLPLFSDGVEGLNRYRQEIRELGGGATPAFIEATADMSKQIRRASIVIDGLRSRIAIVLLPVMNRLVEIATKTGKTFLEMTKHSRFLEIMMVSLGAAALAMGAKMLLAWAAPLATLALAAAAITVVALLVDDLITTFEGGQSVIRSFTDEVFGVGTTQLVVDALKLAWQDLVDIVDEASAAVRGFLEPFGLISEKTFVREQRGARDIEGEDDLAAGAGGGRRRTLERSARGARDIEGEESLARMTDPVRQAFFSGRGARHALDREGYEEAQVARRPELRGVGQAREDLRLRERLASASTQQGAVRTGAPILDEKGRITGREPAEVLGGTNIPAPWALAQRLRNRLDEGFAMGSERASQDAWPSPGEATVAPTSQDAWPSPGEATVAPTVMLPLESRIVAAPVGEAAMLPSISRVNNVQVGETQVNLTINARNASADEVAAIARRELEIVTERERRRTMAALEEGT